MEITIDKLEKGDEVLIGKNGDLRYVTLLKDPVVKATAANGKNIYKAVKCSFKVDRVTQTHSYVDNNGNVRTYNYHKDVEILSPDNHNKTAYVNLDNRQIWLVRKNSF